jgi:hypothetical protein
MVTLPLTDTVVKTVTSGLVENATTEVVVKVSSVTLVVDGGVVVDGVLVVDGDGDEFVSCVVETSVVDVEREVVEVEEEDELDEVEVEEDAEVEDDALAELPVPIGTVWLLACRISRSLLEAEVSESTASSAAKRYAKASL